MFSALSRLIVRWVQLGHWSKFGPSVQIVDHDIEQFIRQLAAGFECSIDLFCVAVVYLIRLHDASVQEMNFRNALHASLSLAYKFMHDERPDSKIHAYAGGLSAADLIDLEMTFLAVVRFKLFVSVEDYRRVRGWVDNELAAEARRRVDMEVDVLMGFHQPLANVANVSLPLKPAFHHSPLVPPTVQPHVPPDWNFQPYSQAHLYPNANIWGGAYHRTLPRQPVQPPPAPLPGAGNGSAFTTEWTSFINPNSVDFSSWRNAVFPQ